MVFSKICLLIILGSVFNFVFLTEIFICQTLSSNFYILDKVQIQVIFGSGDFYKAVTATSNKHFVNAASQQVLFLDMLAQLFSKIVLKVPSL